MQIIHFSRITFLNLLIFLLYLASFKRPEKLLQYVVLAALGTAALSMAFPSVFANYVERFCNTLTEISFAQDTWSHESIVTNWRGYEVHCEIQKFQDAGIFEKMFGGGFGAQLDVHGNAYLVTTEEMLPFLHNGYFTILMIWGISGCVLFVMMLALLYIGSRNLHGSGRSFWRASVAIMALDTFFVHGPFFSAGVSMVFFYLGILDGTGQRRSLLPLHINFPAPS